MWDSNVGDFEDDGGDEKNSASDDDGWGNGEGSQTLTISLVVDFLMLMVSFASSLTKWQRPVLFARIGALRIVGYR